MLKIVLNIILTSTCALFHLAGIIIVACWRHKNYKGGLNHTHFGNFFFFLSLCVLTLCASLQFIYKSWALSIIFVPFLICPILLYVFIIKRCFCIYLEKTSIILKSIFTIINIDLKDKNAYYFVAPYAYEKKYLEVGIVGRKEKIVFSCIGQGQYLAHLNLFARDFMLLNY